ncbi:MAG TPA: metallophosphoesterase family protein [Candidatus Dormibacteraeota bacterium]|nr:metallophosphoesterase family protein [Candidatus Dormibacteraeota bacterium]
MRVAVVSDFHGNLAALEAVVADLRLTSPDVVLQAGDTAVLGPRPAEVVDRLRELAWPGLVGNTDQMLWKPAARAEQEQRAPRLRSWLDVLFGVLGPWAAERLGEQRLAWLRSLPEERSTGGVRLVHASPGDLWRAPAPEAADTELAATYGGQDADVAVYGHIHRPFVRELPGLIVANCGSVGLPWDGDPRAAYLLVDAGRPSVRRVEYDMEQARRDLAASGFPLRAWLEAVQRDARFTRPERV